jgi:hypothetical protein
MQKESRRYPCLRTLLAVITLLFGLQSAALSQEATARIEGTVTDQQGAVIVGAKVTVTNTATKISREAVTDKEGRYQARELPLGAYRITAEHEGFKKVVSDEKSLQINQVLRVDPVLMVGAPSETVEVSVSSSTVETVNPTLGQSVTSRPVVNLPLNGRNVLSLALLQPGVTETTGPSSGGFSVAGGRGDSITYLLDGGNNNNLLSNLAVFNPNPELVAEFRILTSNYTAEYGRNGGGVISVVTKSGTNQLHGSAYDFLRNDALNANTFFNNRDGLPREILKRNQFGFTAGGPLYIPKVVNGKDRMFIFGGYQGQRFVQKTTTGLVTVFTPAQLKGDFSLSNDAGTGPDPNVVDFLQHNSFFQPDPTLASRGIIAPSRINSVAQKYISNNLIPTSATGQLRSQGVRTDNSDDLLIRFDANATEKDQIAVTLGSGRNPTLTPFSGGANVPGYPITGSNRRYYASISETHTFSPRLLNVFRFNTQRINTLQAVPGQQLPTPAALGIGVTPDNPAGPTRISFDGGLTVGFSNQGPTALINNTFTYADTLTWNLGNHGLKFGGSFSPYQNNTVFDFFVNGNFFFSGTHGGIGSGNDLADFLFGLPDEYLQFGEAPSNIRSKSFYGFAQDEWKVRKNLTLTLGLRYEYSQPKIDTQGRSFSLNLGQKSTVFPNAPIGLLFPGDKAPKGANFPDKNDFAPRFGFAWDPFSNGKTSVRGGFGIFYDILKGEDNLQYNGQAPFFGFSDLFFDPLSDNPTREVNYLTQPYVAVGIPNPFPSRPPAKNLDFGAAGFLPIGGGGVFYVAPNLRTPYVYQYNLSLQRELLKNLTLEASYVGTSSHKLTSLVDANPFILGTTTRLFNATPGTPNGTFSYLSEFRNVANGNYNSLELSLNKRTSNTRFFGTTYLTFAYTYSHNIDFASGFRQRGSSTPAYNSKQFLGDSDFDLRHRVSFSGGWDLPFDHAWSSGPKRLTTGWSLYPIITYRTGFPLDVFAGFSASPTAAGPSGAGDRDIVRANLVGPITLFDPKQRQTFRNRAGNYYFDPTLFVGCTVAPNCPNGLPTNAQAIANPSLRTYGSLPRNFFNGPSRTNFDLALAKMTNFREQMGLEFRAEFFNIFNTAQFNNPNTSVAASQFGQITTTILDSQRIIQFALKFIY